jgi:hypothetical protein
VSTKNKHKRRGDGPARPGGAPQAPVGPRRPTPGAGSGSARVPGEGENRPYSLVTATLLGRFEEPFDRQTGEIIGGPVRGTIIDYPDGGGELSACVAQRGGKPQGGDANEWRTYERELRTHGVAEANRLAEERRETREGRTVEEAVRRARSRVRRVVRYYSLTYMVTLTFASEGVHDYNRALRLLQDFIHDHGELLRFGGHYVAVPELHPSGHGWHWHVLVHRRFSKTELEALRCGWTDYLSRKDMGPSGGARFVRIDVKRWGSAAAASGYAAKYVGKTFEGAAIGKGRRRFLISLGAEVEAQRFIAGSVEDVAAVVREEVPGAHVIEVPAEDGRPPIVWAGWDG